MLKVIQHIYMIPLILSTLTSIKSFRSNWPLPYKMFSFLLMLVTFVELFATLWKYCFYNMGNWHYSNSNLWFYNIFIVPQYLLYMAIYYQVIVSTSIKKIILVLAILLPFFSVMNWIYFQSIDSVNSYTLVLTSCVIIFLSIAYFDQLRKEKVIIRPATHPMAWISLGTFVFHTANLPYILSLNYLVRSNVSLAIALFYIFLALNCIMYLCYFIAFLCHPLPRTY